MSKNRKPISNRASKRVFRAGTKTDVKNISPRPMRGGIRL